MSEQTRLETLKEANYRQQRRGIIHAAERIRAQHDPADWPGLHHGPITLERASDILEWWHARYCHGSSLDIHKPAAPKLNGGE